MFHLINLVLRIFSRAGKATRPGTIGFSRRSDATNAIFYIYDDYAAKLHKHFPVFLVRPPYVV